MNVVVRGDVNSIRIGRGRNVQDGTIVHVMHDTHPTNIGDDVTIGHARDRARLHDRRPRADRHGRDRCSNGATIGEDSIVAAGSLVTEGTVDSAAVAGDGQSGEACGGR